jgi:hypothetical protein
MSSLSMTTMAMRIPPPYGDARRTLWVTLAKHTMSSSRSGGEEYGYSPAYNLQVARFTSR